MGPSDELDPPPLDDACRVYREGMEHVRVGRFDEADKAIAFLLDLDNRYARSMADNLEIAKQWGRAGSAPDGRRAFWEWLDNHVS